MTEVPENRPVLRFAPLESARFELRVFRGAVNDVDSDALAAAIDRERVDVAILRIPAAALPALVGFARHGLVPIVADTLVVYDVELANLPDWRSEANPVRLHAVTARDAPELSNTARAVFEDYISHYHANPLFARARILEGYAEWAARHADAGDGSAAWFVERGGERVGFSCYRIEPEGTATGVLNGILPHARGRGAYGSMLRAMLSAFGDLGLRRFEISTQVHNVAVQRAWAAHGLKLRSAWNTVHLNALRSR